MLPVSVKLAASGSLFVVAVASGGDEFATSESKNVSAEDLASAESGPSFVVPESVRLFVAESKGSVASSRNVDAVELAPERRVELGLSAVVASGETAAFVVVDNFCTDEIVAVVD